jgi:hypothetical protein
MVDQERRVGGASSFTRIQNGFSTTMWFIAKNELHFSPVARPFET